MNDYAVKVENLRKEFGTFTAVNNISFEVKKGEIFGFLGPNGAGKSTTIRMLCGLLKPSSGSGEVAGFDIIKKFEKIKDHIGYMSQKFSLYKTLTVEENLDFFAGIYLMSKNEHETYKDNLFKKTELGKFSRRQVEKLPSGARQLLALHCAIQHNPDIVFLDEPTAGVDPLARRYFWEEINSLADRGVTIFITTHYLDEAEECDRIAMIFEGQLAAIGEPEELKSKQFSGTIFQINSQNPNQDTITIQAIDIIRDVTLFGSELHITCKKNTPTDLFAKMLADLNLDTSTLRQIAPSLEDLFISLIARREEQ